MEHRSGPVTPKCLSLWGTRIYLDMQSRWETAKHSFWARPQVLGLSFSGVHISMQSRPALMRHRHPHPHIHFTLSLPVELKLSNRTNLEQSPDEVDNAPDKEAG